MASLRIGSRGSQLALWQANHIASRLRERGHDVTITIIRTSGDKLTEAPITQVGVKGMFTREIEEALAAGTVDLAVHSLKDLPTELGSRFELGAVTAREDPRDAFVSARYASIAGLPSGARVGTSSLRRQAQLRALRPDLEFIALRGNVDTRLRKLEEGQADAIILAAAGLNRLERMQLVRQILPVETMCPAAGQGALGIEIRAGDGATRECVAFLDHADSRRATDCERSLLIGLGGGCQVPIGAFARVQDGLLHLTAVVAHPNGSQVLREDEDGDAPRELGQAVARKLLERGAATILAQVFGENPAPQQP